MIDRYRQELKKIKSIVDSSDPESQQLAIDLFFTSNYAIENGINLNTVIYNRHAHFSLRSLLGNHNMLRFKNMSSIIRDLLLEIITFKNENN